jgi:hypothetical protein
MNFWISLIIVFIISFSIQYFLISLIKTNSIFDINFNTGKLYLSLISALIIITLNFYLFNLSNLSNITNISYKYIYIIILFLIILLILFYKFQFRINDNEYIKQMIEENSNIIMISEKVKNSTSNKELKELSTNIINSQSKQIDDLKNIIKDSKIIEKIVKKDQ